MQDDRSKKPSTAHEEKYRNDPPLDQLPQSGEKRPDKRSANDLTAGRVDERRHRPGKESVDEK